MRGAGSGVGASFTAVGAGLFAVTISASFGLMGTGGVGTGVSTTGAGDSTPGFDAFSVVRAAPVWAGVGVAGMAIIARTGTGTGVGTGAGAVAALTALPASTTGIGTEGLTVAAGLAVIAAGSAAASS